MAGTQGTRSRRLTGRGVVGVLLLEALVLSGCAIGGGPVVSQARAIGSFSELQVGGGIQVVMTIEPTERLQVHAPANLLDAVDTSVSGHVLTIDARRDFIANDPIRVTLAGPGIDRLVSREGARVVVTGLDVDALEVRAEGGSTVTVSGAAGSVRLTVDGGATADLARLVASTVDVGIDGAATASLTAGDQVTGHASAGAQVSVGGGALVRMSADGGARVVQR
jgi:hypothetical protein